MLLIMFLCLAIIVWLVLMVYILRLFVLYVFEVSEVSVFVHALLILTMLFCCK